MTSSADGQRELPAGRHRTRSGVAGGRGLPAWCMPAIRTRRPVCSPAPGGLFQALDCLFRVPGGLFRVPGGLPGWFSRG